MLEPEKKSAVDEAPELRVVDPVPGPRNLLDTPAIGRFVRSRWYPGVFQWPTLIVFVAIMGVLLFGPSDPGHNWGTSMTWVLWWPLIPIVFLLIGRFWCAICPFALITDLVQKLVGNNRPVPRVLKKYGVWIIAALFIVLTWVDHVFGIVESPWGSGMMMLVITTGAVVSGAFWQRRTWCRYVCPLGGMSGNYARGSILELRGTPEKCDVCNVQACYKGSDKAPGCPLYEFPKTMDSNANCNLCGYCVKSCPNDSPRLTLRPPTKELWSVRKPKMDEALLAIVITGMVFVQNVTMLSIWDPMLRAVGDITGTETFSVNFTFIFILGGLIPIGMLMVASLMAEGVNKDSVSQNFAKFGYALIPLVMGGHMGHNLYHLLAEGKSLGFTAAALFGAKIPETSTAVVSNGTLVVLQMVLIVLGMVGSLYAAYRIARGNFGKMGKTWQSFAPYAGLVVLLTAANLWLLQFPMAMRM